ncbi:MAG: hypothetical protein R3E54_11205 [Halioglobus sp.]
MEILVGLSQVLTVAILGLIAAFSYWLDGVRIAFHESDAYREEAVLLMHEDSALMREYSFQSSSLYETGNFTGLLELMHDAQAQTEAGRFPLPLWREMDVFYDDDLNKEQILSDWIAASPDEWVPYAARAEYLVGEGWRARGAELAFKTPQEQFKAMRKALSRAEQDLRKTIALKPAFSGSYYNYLELARNGVGELSEREIIDQALLQSPGSYYLRYRYMGTLEPKWGGSFAQMRRFALESQAQRKDDPRVYQLLGYEYQLRAELAMRDGNYEACVQFHDKAFEYGDLDLWRRGRASCHEKLKNHDLAIADLQVLGMQSGDDSAFARIARAHVAKKRYPEALAAIEKAMALSPYRIAHTNYAGWLHSKMKNDDLALAAYTLTQDILPNDPYAAQEIARIQLSRKQREAALPNLKIAIEYGSEDARKWYLYADVLSHLGRPEHRDALRRYLELVDRGVSRNTRRIRMVEAYLAGEGEFEQ